jgi:MtrB/PioB family decaheme-associated outer membrane protein
MRNRLMIGTAALLLASATFAWAQEKPQANETQQSGQAVSATTTGGTLDIGGRFTSTTGDEARYERYRDLRNGANVNLVYGKVTPDWIFDVKVFNAGYRDQRYAAGFSSRKFKASFFFDQIPLNYSYETRTPYSCSPGTCTLDSSLRSQVQAKKAVGIPSTAAQLGNPSLSIYNGAATPFDLRSRRDTIAGSLIYSATDNLDLTFDINSYKRTGNMPWGASFAFPVGVEVPLDIDNRTTDVTAGIEWASHQGMMRVAYDYSKFNQNIPSFTWDNPQFATDYNLNKTTVTGYDPSGYSNGNGPARGRLAMPPTNTLTTFNWLGMVKLPNRTTANASFMMGANKQNEALIPWTINPVIANSKVYAVFPGLAALPRDTAQMAVNYTAATLNVSSRPNRYVTINARYRYDGRNDFSPMFNGEEYVRFDAVPEETGGESEPYQINQNRFDANVTFNPFAYNSVRVGYGYNKWQHTTRATEGWRDNTARVSWDTVGNEYVSLHALYEHTKRDTINFNDAIIEEMGMQPAARFFDEAARARNRATFIVEVNPLPIVGVDFTAATGKDDYQGADPNQQFGLLNNKNTVYTIGVNVAPDARVNLGAEYGRETYNSLQASRSANPAPDPSWTDPARNWDLANDEKVNNFSAYANLVKLITKTDIRFGYDYSDSDNAFVHDGPWVSSLAVLGQFVALPDVTNKWQRLTASLKYDITAKVGVGFDYWFEKFDVADFATINTAGPDTLPRAGLGTQTDTPRIDWLGELMTGYGNRPYKGQTVFARLFYSF